MKMLWIYVSNMADILKNTENNKIKKIILFLTDAYPIHIWHM